MKLFTGLLTAFVLTVSTDTARAQFIEVSGEQRADVNGDGGTNIADPIYLLNFLFSGGPPPHPITLQFDCPAAPSGSLDDILKKLRTAPRPKLGDVNEYAEVLDRYETYGEDIRVTRPEKPDVREILDEKGVYTGQLLDVASRLVWSDPKMLSGRLAQRVGKDEAIFHASNIQLTRNGFEEYQYAWEAADFNTRNEDAGAHIYWIRSYVPNDKEQPFSERVTTHGLRVDDVVHGIGAWRLPTVRELLMLVDYGARESEYLPEDWYWSETWNGSTLWHVYSTGDVKPGRAARPVFVRTANREDFEAVGLTPAGETAQ